jgi:hypothetical protein
LVQTRPGLDAAAGAVEGVGVPGPDAGAEPVEGVVGDLDGVVEVTEPGDRHDRPEDLLLEDPHRVVALEDGRLDVEAAGQVPAQLDPVAADGDLGALPAGAGVGLRRQDWVGQKSMIT